MLSIISHRLILLINNNFVIAYILNDKSSLLPYLRTYAANILKCLGALKHREQVPKLGR